MAKSGRRRVGVDVTGAAFLTWQCELRKRAMREQGGRPSPGMCPIVQLADGTRIGPIVVLLVKRAPASEAAQLRFMAARTQDPAERYRRGLRFLQAEYYLRPQDFASELAAVFGKGSDAAEALVADQECRLLFAEGDQRFELACQVRELAPDDDAWQASYWHNRLFNPELRPDCRILAFSPEMASQNLP